MKYRTMIGAFVAALAGALILNAGTGLAKDLRLGGVHAPTSFETQGLNKFAELVASKTGGNLKVNVYPAGQLGDAVSMIENVMMGGLDMFANVADWNQNVVKDYGILAMPFAFRDLDHVKNFQKSDIYKRLTTEMLKDKGLRVLADNWYRLPRVLVTKKPVFSVDDLKDAKLRMANIESYLKTWQALGAKPTVIPWAEAYLALKTGVVEGLDSPLSSVFSQKFYQAAQFITLTRHSIAPFNVLISEKVYQALPADQQKALIEAGREAGDFYTKAIEDSFAGQKRKMLDDGTKIVEISTKGFVEKARTVAAEFEKNGMWSTGLFDAVQKL